MTRTTRATSHDRHGPGPVAALAVRLIDRLPALAAVLEARILDQVAFYRDGDVVPGEELRRSCHDNLEFMFRRVAAGDADLAAPRATGRLRAVQGVPLAAVQNAFRLAAALVWESIVAEARRDGALPESELVAVAGQMWSLHELFTTEMENTYQDTLVEQALRRDLERSAMVEALLQGRAVDTASVWNAADVLGLPRRGLFVVVAAEVPVLARQALPGIAERLRERDLGSAWCLLPDVQVGIVSVRVADRLDELLAAVRAQAGGRVGIGPPYQDFATTPRSLHLARIAMVSSPPGTPAVNVFDRSPLSMLVASSPGSARRTAEACFGPLAQATGAESEVLLTTLQTYFEVGGSVPDTAARLSCHPNTVRHRLKRVEARTGHALGDPRGAAELLVAVQALRWLAAADPEPPAP